jgi:hypothetical protein
MQTLIVYSCFLNDAGKNSNRKASGKIDSITVLNWMTQVCPQA